MSRVSLRRKSDFVPTEGQPISNARLAADLQALTLALRIGGLEGLRTGQIRMATTKRDSGFPR
jgi:hypothetical protein